MQTSLPLMGIGNPECCGDGPSRNGPAHYPSWGSGTRARADAMLARMALITPHGDREPPGCGPSHRPVVRPHYPSWGSGTSFLHRGEVPTTLRLITPHGDRELNRRVMVHQHDHATHYPSWGSGTRTRHFVLRTSGSHYPSWGSGTRERIGMIPAVSKLITPHGDRERCLRADAGQAQSRRLITPHGDRERAHIANLSAQFNLITPHGDRELVPLMGIGNELLDQFLLDILAYLYPSWGSGTPSLFAPCAFWSARETERIVAAGPKICAWNPVWR